MRAQIAEIRMPGSTPGHSFSKTAPSAVESGYFFLLPDFFAIPAIVSLDGVIAVALPSFA